MASKLRAHLGQFVARLALAGTQVLKGCTGDLGSLARINLGLTGLIECTLKLLGAVATALE